MTRIDFDTLDLQENSHVSPADGMCVMEAVAYFANEPHTDHPECASPVLASFLRNWNDDLYDGDRNRLLKPLILRMVGTRSTPAVELRRRFLLTDWLIRTYTPRWLRLADHGEAAQVLEELPEITLAIDRRTLLNAIPGLSAFAWKTWATREASRQAAGDAVRNTTWEYSAYGERDQPWASERYEPFHIATDQAFEAALHAVWEAEETGADISRTVTELQLSAVGLIDRMIEAQ